MKFNYIMSAHPENFPFSQRIIRLFILFDSGSMAHKNTKTHIRKHAYL